MRRLLQLMFLGIGAGLLVVELVQVAIGVWRFGALTWPDTGQIVVSGLLIYLAAEKGRTLWRE